MENSSTVKFFSLSGLQETRTNKFLYFVLTLLIYLLIILCNLILILTIIVEKGLHEPMYIFVCNLCANGLFGTVGFYPKILVDLLSDIHTISYGGCMTQVYFIYSSVLCEITILTAMAYDRYVAICKPLNYHAVMTSLMICKLLLFAWCFPLFSAAVLISFTATMPLCGSHIQKLYCDNWSVVKLSCVPTTLNNVCAYIIILSQMAQVVFIMYSYVLIVSVCVKSKEGRTKFMQTCLPHLLALINFCIATLFDVFHSRYGASQLPLSLRNIMAIEFLVIPPLINPIIYGLSLREIKRRILKVFDGRCKDSQGPTKQTRQQKNGNRG
ncbi:olfactory receptor 6N1-like [Anguilla rostrata]|uniref:olfactory receptor 6N1-like n=1 Tax=Anguilla rostrata TaxID=7938 RepID=UPI0030CC0177